MTPPEGPAMNFALYRSNPTRLNAIELHTHTSPLCYYKHAIELQAMLRILTNINNPIAHMNKHSRNLSVQIVHSKSDQHILTEIRD